MLLKYSEHTSTGHIYIYIHLQGTFLNKRPKGVDVLLGHLLVNRILVMYKLSVQKPLNI